MIDVMRCLPDPDHLGESEYRAIHEVMEDALADCPEDERREAAESIAEAFVDAASFMLRALRRSREEV